VKRISILAAVLALFPAASIAAEPPADAPAQTRETRCLFADRVDGFKDAKTDSVILTEGSRDFLVTFTARCRGLKWANKVATVARGGTCLTPGDKIVFEETQGFTEHCYIKTIEMIVKPKPAETPS
jgi:hypothetical protein